MIFHHPVVRGVYTLVLFPDSLGVGLAVGIKAFLAALSPCRFQLGCGDVPVGSAFLGHGTQVLSKIFQCRPAEEPVSHIDLVYNESRLEDNGVWDHRIMQRIRIFGDIEIFLDFARRIGKEWPVGAGSAAKFIRLSNIVGANSDQPAIANFELPMKLHEPFVLPAVLGAKTSAAQNKNHGVLSLQFGELPVFAGMIGKFVIGKLRSGNNVSSHTGYREEYEGLRPCGRSAAAIVVSEEFVCCSYMCCLLSTAI